MHDTEGDKLNRILAQHYELQILGQNDANVYAWFQMVYAGKCTVEEALIGLVVTGKKTEHRYYQMIVKLKMEASPKT